MTDQRPSDPDDTRELLAAFTLDAVDDEERARVEALIAIDPAARDEAARYEDAIAALAADDVAVEPPAGTWAAIQARIAASPRPPVAGPETEGPEAVAPVVPLDAVARRGPRTAPRTSWRIAGVAAAVVALLVAAAAVIGLSRQGGSRSSELVAALESPTTRVGNLSGSAGEARVVLTADGRGYLTTGGLERPAAGKVYQLWLGDSGAMVSLGVVEDDGIARFEAPAGSRQLALSLEERPGAEEPSLPPVATGELA